MSCYMEKTTASDADDVMSTSSSSGVPELSEMLDKTTDNMSDEVKIALEGTTCDLLKVSITLLIVVLHFLENLSQT